MKFVGFVKCLLKWLAMSLLEVAVRLLKLIELSISVRICMKGFLI